ncbi:MAG: EamA family transporter, partial [Muribaculaceae bacterium]|nr:EamA family transporter [Muribaculaceae bacterium]
ISKGLDMEIHPIGDILAISCALSWAVYSIAIKRLIPIYSTLFLTRKLFFYGLITSIPLLLLQREPLHIEVLFDISQPQYLLNLLFLAVSFSYMAYLLWI